MQDGGGNGGTHAGVRFPPPLIFLGLLLAGLAADDLLALNPAMPQWLRAAGYVIAVTGLLSIAWALAQFRQAGNNPEPWKPDTAFVATGLYRITRNPMYLGMALAYLGLALAMDSLGALLLWPVAVALIDRLVIMREERHLLRRFGPAYEDYRTRVRRWI